MNEELVVTKANSLIEASYRLNISEQRVLALLVAQIPPDDEDFKPYRFKAAALQTLIENANKDEHKRLKELVRGLFRKTLQIRRSHGGWIMTNWLSSAEYFPGKGEVELCFDPKLKPYLLQLQERFTSYKLLSIVKLRSRHSVRLYELLKQYESLGKRSYDLAELRNTLGLHKEEYSTWYDFKKRVLEPAKRELPKKTDLEFNYTTRKHVRAVAFVDFVIWSIDRNKLTKKNASKKKPTKKNAGSASSQINRSESPRKQAESCYRENDFGTKCKVQDIAALNALPKQRQAICFECPAHQQALFDSSTV